jgi:ATP-dependent Clp protease ATP-binding subunit ClpB
VAFWCRRQSDARLEDEYLSTEHLLVGMSYDKGFRRWLAEAERRTHETILNALRKVRGGQRVTDQKP